MKHIRGILIVSAGLAIGTPVYAGTISFSEIPLYLTYRADPNVLFNMSIESPTVGAAYNDQNDTGQGGSCAGRPANEGGFSIGTCYFKNKAYIGYFNPDKCYTYSSSRFNVSSNTLNTNHECSGAWSGNFLNWTTMTAIDEFRAALTGGNRSTDTTTTTVLERANQALAKGHTWAPIKKIGSSVGPGNVVPSTVSPYTSSTLYIWNHGTQMDIGTSTNTNQHTTNLNVRVRVCTNAANLEDNCTPYGTNYKPDGLIQKNAHRMRFALTSFLLDGAQSRDGGVLRAKMKYTGAEDYVPGVGASTNLSKEWNETTGQFLRDPDDADSDGSRTGNVDSGVINYINKFGANGYKSYDPASELFYESIRYFKGTLGPTPEYSSGLTSAMADGFPVITNWNDPIQTYCQKNFIVGINDANPWLDKRLPGTFFTSDKVTVFSPTKSVTRCNSATVTVTAVWRTATGICANAATNIDSATCGTRETVIDNCQVIGSDYGEPSNADSTINVRTLTNSVGALEGLNGTSWTNSGSWSSNGSASSISGTNDSVGGSVGTGGDFSNGCSDKTVSALGEVMGTCGFPGKQNSYYIAGLAYYANTQDLRPDLDDPDTIGNEKQTVATYMIDTQEYATNPLDGPKNMLWLAGKYGGFQDRNNDGIPNGAANSEWDADGDGVPDNYVFASQPEKMVAGLTNAFNDIKERTSSASSVAANSTALNTGSHIYQARFATSDWSGQLLSYSISTTGVISATDEWDAGQLLNSQAPSSRVILTFNDAPSSGSPDGVAFQWSNLNTSQQAALNTSPTGTTDTYGDERLDWLRGDSTNEIGGSGSLTFRKRATSKLGDIINSNPVYVGPPSAGYPDASYATFRGNNSGRTPIIYVGANDGMLHAIDASCDTATAGCPPTANSGKEVMAYVPRPVYKNLTKLISTNYNGAPSAHRYFVDGTPTVADVQIGGTWKTVVVGGLGAGGQGIYALDATNPGDFSESNASSLVLWEFTDAHDKDLGYTFSQPQVAKMANGKWAVIVGNGYNNSESDGATTTSINGHAVLYILFIEQGTDGAWTLGTDFIKLDTMAGSAATPNSLATPFVADVNGNGVADYIYVGDLQGNMWKFDVTDPVAASWAAPLKLFTATDAVPNSQPITSSVEVTAHPNGGFMVLFGTGQYLQTADITSPYKTQSFYGIWDKNDGTTVNRTQLQEQTVLGEVSSNGLDYRITSSNAVDYTSKLGWYIDLPSSDTTGERDVFNPVLRLGRIIFTTLIPVNNACDGGGTSWLMELEAITGKRLLTTPFSTDGDTTFENSAALAGGDLLAFSGANYVASGRKSTVGITNTPNVISGPAFDKKKEYKVVSGSSGTTESILENAAGASGRLNWREIIKD